jgi:broad specificity phosphatase PhoE
MTGASFARGEAFAAFEKRVLAAIMRLLGTSDWRRLLLVAHDAVVVMESSSDGLSG